MELGNIQQSQALRERNDLSPRIAARSQAVADEIKLSTATAEWDVMKDSRDRDVLLLHIRDPFGAESHGRFALAEVEDERRFRERLHDLLGAALRIMSWRRALRSFFREAAEWVQRHDNSAIIREETIELNEQRSGPYLVPALHVTTGRGAAQLRPVACWVVGADGRVDLSGIGGLAVCVLDEMKRGWFWISDPPLARLEKVTEELFCQLLDVVLS